LEERLTNLFFQRRLGIGTDFRGKKGIYPNLEGIGGQFKVLRRVGAPYFPLRILGKRHSASSYSRGANFGVLEFQNLGFFGTPFAHSFAHLADSGRVFNP